MCKRRKAYPKWFFVNGVQWTHYHSQPAASQSATTLATLCSSYSPGQPIPLYHYNSLLKTKPYVAQLFFSCLLLTSIAQHRLSFKMLNDAYKTKSTLLMSKHCKRVWTKLWTKTIFYFYVFSMLFDFMLYRRPHLVYRAFFSLSLDFSIYCCRCE